MSFRNIGALKLIDFDITWNKEEIEKTVNNLHMVFRTLEETPMSKEDLEPIAKASVTYANELVKAYGAVTNIKGKRHLVESTKYIVGDNYLQLYNNVTDPKTYYPYAASMEFGFHPFGRSFFPPRPFLRPAFEFAKENTKESLAQSTKNILEHNYIDIRKPEKNKPQIFNVGARVRQANYGAGRQSRAHLTSAIVRDNKWTGITNK